MGRGFTLTGALSEELDFRFNIIGITETRIKRRLCKLGF